MKTNELAIIAQHVSYKIEYIACSVLYRVSSTIGNFVYIICNIYKFKVSSSGINSHYFSKCKITTLGKTINRCMKVSRKRSLV